jgi:tRNA 2-thiocytidine biosynthesis protein TtcA
MFGFVDLKTDGVANLNGDIAFDEEPCSTSSTVPGTIPLQPL